MEEEHGSIMDDHRTLSFKHRIVVSDTPCMVCRIVVKHGNKMVAVIADNEDWNRNSCEHCYAKVSYDFFVGLMFGDRTKFSEPWFNNGRAV